MKIYFEVLMEGPHCLYFHRCCLTCYVSPAFFFETMELKFVHSLPCHMASKLFMSVTRYIFLIQISIFIFGLVYLESRINSSFGLSRENNKGNALCKQFSLKWTNMTTDWQCRLFPMANVFIPVSLEAWQTMHAQGLIQTLFQSMGRFSLHSYEIWDPTLHIIKCHQGHLQ